MNLFQAIKWLFGGARPNSTDSNEKDTLTRQKQEIADLKHEAESLLAENFEDASLETTQDTNDSASQADTSEQTIAVGTAAVSPVAEIAASYYSNNRMAETNNDSPEVEPGSAGVPLATDNTLAGTKVHESSTNTTTRTITTEATATKHIIVGAGPAGIIAAETIRKLDRHASITIIGDEPEAPYSRMAIPYFLEENIQAEGTHLRKTNNHFADANIDIIQQPVTAVDPVNNLVELADGQKLAWDKLLIATGSHPTKPPIPGLDNPKVANCWTLADSRKIIDHVKQGSHVVQIGAGFIGCIILEALVKRGANLTVVEMDNRMVPRMLDEQCGGMLKSWCESKGVTVLTETQVTGIEDSGDGLKINLSQGDALNVDFVISATGVRSNTEFLESSGIKLDQGILVNEHLESSIPGIYAAGDVAQGIDFTTGGYSVHAIQPTAADHGIICAKNMVQGNATRHKGSLQMNVLSTLDLISTSYGAWEGVEGGECSELVDADRYRYIRLQFDGDKLVGANTLGITQNIGALRGLIQSKTSLGIWKERLMENPLHFMDAYVSLTGNHT